MVWVVWCDPASGAFFVRRDDHEEMGFAGGKVHAGVRGAWIGAGYGGHALVGTGPVRYVVEAPSAEDKSGTVGQRTAGPVSANATPSGRRRPWPGL